MAYVSVMAQQLHKLLLARNWQCEANRFVIRATEPALDDVHHIWMAGDAASMSDGEVMQVRPARIIVPDMAASVEVERLSNAMTASGREPRINSYTRFVDQLWDAPRAAARARRDAENQESLAGFFEIEGTPGTRRVKQELKLGMDTVSDNRLLERSFSIDGFWLAILADAGLGKTELLKWHEWRYAVFYESAYSQGAPALPAVALRIPLRGLRSLSLDAFAHYLSHPSDENDLPPLTKIDSGRFLIELLRLRRIVLLLDGLDELSIGADKLTEGLRELRKVVKDGALIAVSSRKGHLNSNSSIRVNFGPAEVAEISPMPPDDGFKLLTKYGATKGRANEVLAALNGSPAQGIPLFLLMAYLVGLSTQLDQRTLVSRTRVLLELLTLFCKRDEPRLDIDDEEQMRMLTEFAHWSSLLGPLGETEALEHLGIDREERSAAMILNPHSLLTRRADELIEFKYPQFFALFTAKALCEDWQLLGVNSIVEDLRSNKLDDTTIEYLARMVSVEDVRASWMKFSHSANTGRYPLVRRNLLAITLAKLEDEAESDTPKSRADKLATLLGEQVIIDVLFSGLVIRRIDLQGWKLRRLKGTGGSLTYCTNLHLCDHDDSILELNLDGTERPQPVDEEAVIASGLKRLGEMLRPLRRKGTSGLISMMTFAEAKDKSGWRELSRAGFAVQKKVYGTRSWVLLNEKLGALTKFSDAYADGAARVVVTNDTELKAVVVALGQLR